jgi:hypothetical protein
MDAVKWCLLSLTDIMKFFTAILIVATFVVGSNALLAGAACSGIVAATTVRGAASRGKAGATPEIPHIVVWVVLRIFVNVLSR